MQEFSHDNIVKYIDDFPFDIKFCVLHILVMENCEGKESGLTTKRGVCRVCSTGHPRTRWESSST